MPMSQVCFPIHFEGKFTTALYREEPAARADVSWGCFQWKENTADFYF